MATGGGRAPIIRVQADDFDAAAVAEGLTKGRADIGAVVTFVGLCRDEGGALAALEIEHYAGMAEAEIARVAEEAAARWPLLGLVAIHRFGLIEAGGRIVLVAAAAAHRGEAFGAANFLMDYLKTRAPFWKRAHRADGALGAWVEPRSGDDAAAARWRADG
ncbi:MAG TPA: molybdenum cofactor biosynthesis protein MoaE [Roseiarcus sp.]|nr:molybdenum cofactor biosynthesis protein MoaE [Roseiarcus sp.]